MRRFTELYLQLEQPRKASWKVAALRSYFAEVDGCDAAWALHFLGPRKQRRLVSAQELRAWSCETAGIDPWLFEESYSAVGDLAETASLILPRPSSAVELPLHELAEQFFLPLADRDVAGRRELVLSAWRQLENDERFVFNKLITGGLRLPGAASLLARGLAEASGLPGPVIAHRLRGNLAPVPGSFEGLLAEASREGERLRPYPFCCAEAFQSLSDADGEVGEWAVEWQWDGVRAQLIRRGGESFLWSRREEPLLELFPELIRASAGLPNGTVLDGEIIGIRDGKVLPRPDLERRLHRKRVENKLLAEVPAVFIAFDLLESSGVDVRGLPFRKRRGALTELLQGPKLNDGAQPAAALMVQQAVQKAPPAENGPIGLSPILSATNWTEYQALCNSARQYGARGLILKRLDSRYHPSREGSWKAWKPAPFRALAVLMYVQRERERDGPAEYTFAVWNDGQLVPFARTRCELPAEQQRLINAFVDSGTVERFGPVRMLRPELVFEIAFEGLHVSRRRKCGFEVRSPRLVRWRDDLAAADADSAGSLERLCEGNSASSAGL